MYLQNLINLLEAADPTQVVPMGFHNPHSYRGYYRDLAFEPKEGAAVSEMLDCAKSALGTTYQGYKGGDFVMSEYTEVWLANEGDTGESIGPVLMNYMLNNY
jgi:hypothetical protein